jgi:hypothetical protein
MLRMTTIIALSVAVCLARPTLAQPANDGCGASQPIAGFSSVPWDTTSATTDGADNAVCCAFSSCAIYNDIWFCWTATETGPVVARTCGLTKLDTRLAVYSGCSPCPDAGGILACNDDSCDLQSAVAWSAVAGQHYLIRLGSFGTTDYGSGVLEIAADFTPTPPSAACNTANPPAVLPAGSTVLSATVTPGANPPSIGLAVTVDLGLVGGGAAVTMLDNGVPPDAVAGDNTFTVSVTVGAGTAPGAKLLPISVMDSESRTATCDLNLTVLPPGTCPCDDSADFDELEECDPSDPGSFVNINGGCIEGSSVIPIACGQRVCGTAHTYESAGQMLRDTDFYELSLTGCARVTWCVRAEFPVEISIIQPPCGELVYRGTALGSACQEVCVTSMLPAGTYWLFVAPQLGTSVMCGSQYRASVICEPCSNSPPVCDRCCGRMPQFVEAAGFRATTAVVTQQRDFLHSDRVLEIIDLSNQPSAPLGAHWDAARFYDPSPDQAWSIFDLGTVFGVTLDDEGNIYLAHTSIYGNDANWGGPPPFDRRGKRLNPPNPDPPGSIYKIDTSTGVSSWLRALPNSLDTAIDGQFDDIPDEADRYPGLGNICFDCGTDMLYVSNFEDGRIYRLSKAGTIFESYKHSTGAVDGYPFPMGAMSDPDDPSAGWIQVDPHPLTERGQRVWAVQTSQGRLYYSVWRENVGQGSLDYSNEIWSVAIAPVTGDFMIDSQRLEIQLPGLGSSEVSNPVSDISFTDECCMLLAERSMWDDTTSTAHGSRLLEYCWINNTWTGSGNVFRPGYSGAQNSSAGGVDFDFQAGRDVRAHVWGTADQLLYPASWTYGIIGFPSTGGTPANSLIVDSDDDIRTHDKTQQGDVEITCPMCITIEDVRLDCVPGDEHLLEYTFTIINHSNQQASAVQFDVMGPPDFSFPPPTPVSIPPGGTATVTTTITRTYTDGLDLYLRCFKVILLDPAGVPICDVTHCLFLGLDCHCGQATHEVQCIQTLASTSFHLELSIQNLSPITARRITLAPWGLPAPPVHFSSTSFSATLSPFGGMATISTTLTGVHSGDDICIEVTLHDAVTGGAVICSFIYCLTLPNCDFDIFDGGIDLAGSNFEFGDVISLTGGVHGCVAEMPAFQWRHYEVNLTDNDRITGANTPTLTITAAEYSDEGPYDLVATTSFQTLIMGPVSVSVIGPPCPADINDDRTVDLPDLTLLLGHFGNPGIRPDGDINGDGLIDLTDLTLMLSAFGISCD